MNRRKLITGLSIGGIIGLSGCIDRLNLEEHDDFNSDEQIKISIDEIAQNPTLSRYRLNFDVEVEKETADEDGPPQIRVSVENLQDDELILTGKTRSVFGGETDSSSEQSVLLLQPEEWTKDQLENNNCYKLKQDIPRVGTQYETNLTGISEESIILDLIGSPTSNQCIPIGKYRFETNYQILIPDELDGNQEIDEFEWGFIIHIYKE